jgi:2-desacetyl-2-hydroxyethyl bacteriochlorophyllide A dehydrogenase
MGKVVQLKAPRRVVIAPTADEPLGPRDVRIRTLSTGISTGTELTAYRGTSPYLSKRWDSDRRLFVAGDASVRYPMDEWGYEEVGEVVEVGPDVRAVAVGQRIWGIWGHRTSTVKTEEYAAARVLDPDADPVVGIFSHIGAVALNTMLDADIHVGETAVVFGLGVPGQLVAQLARLNGAQVIAVDTLPARLDLAAKLGADVILHATEDTVAERVRDLTEGRGADVVVEVSGRYEALHEAIRTAAYNSRVVAAGFYQGPGAGLVLGEELHHNRIQVVSSQISGVSAANQHRWDRDRLARTAIEFAVTGRLDVQSLISHRLRFDAAADGFRLLDEHPEQALQVVLDVDAEVR